MERKKLKICGFPPEPCGNDKPYVKTGAHGFPLKPCGNDGWGVDSCLKHAGENET
jgi:hypothetical protein